MSVSARDRRVMTFLGLALVVVVAASLLMFSGGSGKSNATSALGAGSTQSAGQSLPAQTPLSAKAPLLVFSGRDPFLPLILATVAPTGPTVSPAGSPNASPGGGSSITIGGHNVVLDSIFTVNGSQKVQVEVDGKVYTVAPGGTFAGNFKLVSISGSCANFTFGDQAFTLCVSAHK